MVQVGLVVWVEEGLGVGKVREGVMLHDWLAVGVQVELIDKVGVMEVVLVRVTVEVEDVI